MRELSYAQRFEDFQLLRCFEAQQDGFYIDVGAGHPVYDNVSLAFYLRGWRGIAVEPNPRLAQLAAALRPRDRLTNALCGTARGTATFYLVDHYHGLSTTIADNAQAAREALGKEARQLTVPVTTLAALCEAQAPQRIDFLKIDVEGAEAAVIEGGDWKKFRPRVVVAEAVAPITMAPNHETYEPLLLRQGYRFAHFDGLNRYYAAEEEPAIAAILGDAPAAFDQVARFGDFGPAREDVRHPDHQLAVLLRGADPVELPLLRPDALADLLVRDIPEALLSEPADESSLAEATRRLFGRLDRLPGLSVRAGMTLRDLYAEIVGTEDFRLACGRISASSAW